MRESYRVLNALLRTEKGSLGARYGKYLFSVGRGANKIQIKKAVEDAYKVKVSDVNTQVVPGKLKKVRVQQGRTAEWKKAIVTLKEGHKIE